MRSGVDRAAVLNQFNDAPGEHRPYCPVGPHRELLTCRDPEVIIAGGVGTGKSRTTLEKIHACCEKYTGCRVFIGRQTRESLTNTTLVTYEEWVVPVGHAVLEGARRENRTSYKYANGSEIVLGGFDDPQKLMSSEYDLIYVPECKEIEESSWYKASTRLRNFRMPYQQMLGDTNPDHPQHWILQRVNRGDARLITTKLEDNPRYYDVKTGEWTPEGQAYVERVDKLTGYEYQRLRLGLWVAAEGARFPQLTVERHSFKFADVFPMGIYPGAKIILGLDYGLRAPYCALWTLIDHDGHFWVYREDYQAGLTSDLQAKRVVEMTMNNEKIHTVFADPACWANFPGHQGPTNRCTADYYREEFNKDQRFGPLVKGFNKERRHAFDTIDKLLNEGRLHIDRDRCPNLWRELQAAIWDVNLPDKEDIDKKCDDHALTAGYYGWHTWMNPPEIEKTNEINYDDIRKAQFANAGRARTSGFRRV